MNEPESTRAKSLIAELAVLGAPETEADQVRIFELLKDLEALGGTGVADPLVSAPDPELKVLLGDFLSFTGGPGAHGAFTRMFEDLNESEEIRARAAYHLGYMGDEATLSTLSRVASDASASSTLRLGALAGIRSYYTRHEYQPHHTPVRRALAETALRDRSHPVRRDAARTLGSLKWAATEDLVHVLRSVQREWPAQAGDEERRECLELARITIGALAAAGYLTRSVLDVLEKTYELDEDVRGPIVQAVGALHGKTHRRRPGDVSDDALDFLLRNVLAKSRDEYLLTVAARALSEIGIASQAALDVLRAAHDRVKDPFARTSIADTLSRLQRTAPH